MRAALSDYYFNSMRLVPANMLWGAGAIVVIVVALVWPVGAFALLPLLAMPTAGVFRLTARIVRGAADAGWSEIIWPYRHATGAILVLGAAVVVGGLILTVNVLSGLAESGPFGLVLATVAAWSLVAGWCAVLVVWPLLVDPDRVDRPVRERLWLAGTLLLIDPVRFLALGLAAAVIGVVSTVLTVAILTVSVSFIALVACRIVYPAADRFEAALGMERA